MASIIERVARVQQRIADRMTALPAQVGDANVANRRKPRLVCTFRRSQSGAAAIEFGIVAVPFFALLCAIFETALVFWTNEVLEQSLSEASRRLLTGQAASRYTSSNPTTNANAFRDDICAVAPMGLIDCSKLFVDVKVYSNFAGANSGTTNPAAGGTLNTSGFSYNQPQPGQIVVARAVLEYRLFLTAWASKDLANIGSGRRALVATTAFRTEPFTPPTQGTGT